MSYLVKPIYRLSCARPVYMDLFRNLRGQGRKRYFNLHEESQVTTTYSEESAEASHPSNSHMQINSAMFAVTEERLQKLSHEMPALIKKNDEIIEELPEPVTEENKHEMIAQCISPFHKIRYSSQLEQKDKKAKEVLKLLKRRLTEVRAPPLSAPQPGLPCPLQSIAPSPELLQYRNKDEFMVYRGVDGNPKTVGFMTGHPKLDTTVCVPPTNLIIIRDKHKDLCQHFEKFIRSSTHPSCIHFRDAGGVWRSVVARSNKRGDLMAVVIIHPYTLHQDEINKIEDDLKEYFTVGLGAAVGLTSLYLQVCSHTKCSREQAPYKLLYGQPYITEQCGGLDFKVSPDTFFQINTAAAEVLYGQVLEVAELSPLTTLLDIGCGSGSIGLLLAGQVRGVVGVDAVHSAVEDATHNARHNGISNATFIPGNAEKVLPHLSEELTGCSDVLAIVNPGRGGLHPQVIHSLRKNPAINKLLYLSCRPEGYALDNFVSFGNMLRKSKLSNFAPFVPRYAFTVDMFPHTNHYEMGLLFHRVTEYYHDGGKKRLSAEERAALKTFYL